MNFLQKLKKINTFLI